MNERHLGSDLDDVLRADGVLDEVEAGAAKRVVAIQIVQEMARSGVSRSELARRMRTSRSAVDRLLDPGNPSVTLDTLQRAAQAVGRTLVVRLGRQVEHDRLPGGAERLVGEADQRAGS